MFFYLFLAIIFTKQMTAQTIQDVVGAYTLRGVNHYLKSDQTFVIIGYATLTGKWELKEKGLVLFTPDRPKEKFILYGRHNRNIGDSVKIMLSNGFYDDETMLHFGELKKPVPELKRIFKPGHRHISFPYIYTTKANADFVSFSYFNYSEETSPTPEIYTFTNKENYNDFIGFYFEDKYQYKPFYYHFKIRKLYFDDDSFSEKEDLETVLQEKSSELFDLIKNLTNLDFSPQKIFYTPLYNEFNRSDEEFKLNFEFNKDKNAWINTLNYIDNEEISKDYDYNTINILYEYQQLNDFTKQKNAIKIDQKPIFISNDKD